MLKIKPEVARQIMKMTGRKVPSLYFFVYGLTAYWDGKKWSSIRRDAKLYKGNEIPNTVDGATLKKKTTSIDTWMYEREDGGIIAKVICAGRI